MFLFLSNSSLLALNRYPRWQNAEDGTASAPSNSKGTPLGVPGVTAAAESLTDESHEFERTASSVGHLENVSNLSPSVQKLLRDFATDTDELTGSESASALRSSSLASPSEDQALGNSVDDQIRAAAEESVLVRPDVSQPVDADTAVTSQLAAITTSTADALSLNADVTQVLEFGLCSVCVFVTHFLSTNLFAGHYSK